MPRHDFVPAELQHEAYADSPLPIGHGQTISQPYIVALMTQLLAPDAHARVLEIGTGCGYQAAVLAELAGQVYTLEVVPALAAAAARRLAALGYDNVVCRPGDGYLGWPEAAPFDRVIITAAAPYLPRALLEQLAPGGRLVAPVAHGAEQQLVVADKGADGVVATRVVLPVAFVPLVRVAPAD